MRFEISNTTILRASLVLLASLSIGCMAVNTGSAAKEASTILNVITLSGQWQFQPTNIKSVSAETTPDQTQAWQSISVPDNWFRQGKDIHGQAWYRKQFEVAPKVIGRHVRLVFQGVDYASDVWINGHYLGYHEGYFQPFDFDVSRYLHAGGNELTVLVDSPLEKPDAWSFNKRLLKGIFSHHDTRPGGAWSVRGQEQNTGGIWAPVRLDISDQL
ncbi:MAG: sugar-binding domain-containing protein, partial [Methylophilaceae bacterium]